jgi:hypothetical protein
MVQTFRRNNPGNIRYNPANKWQGQTGTEGGFVVFSTPEFGLRAMAKLLYNYQQQGFKTLSAIINKYAPPSENATTNYIKFVSDKVRIPPNMIVPDELMPFVASAMIQMETGQAVTTATTEYLKTKFAEFYNNIGANVQAAVNTPWPWLLLGGAILLYSQRKTKQK